MVYDHKLNVTIVSQVSIGAVNSMTAVLTVLSRHLVITTSLSKGAKRLSSTLISSSLAHLLSVGRDTLPSGDESAAFTSVVPNIMALF